MGLLSAATGAISGVLADQWREYFYCEAMGTDVLVSKGQKRVNDKRSSNTKASDNIITNGSIIAVNDGQFMMIVEQGKVVDFTAESGEYVYDKSTPRRISGFIISTPRKSLAINTAPPPLFPSALWIKTSG